VHQRLDARIGTLFFKGWQRHEHSPNGYIIVKP
jgi:hypothetical protein